MQEALALVNVGGDIFSASSIHESMKKNLSEKESIITKLRHNLLENKKQHYLGCNSEIEKLKSQISSLQYKSILQLVSLLYTPNENYLRAQQFE